MIAFAGIVPPKLFLDRSEVCAALGVSRRHFYELERAGAIRPVLVPGYTRKRKVPRDQVVALAESLI